MAKKSVGFTSPEIRALTTNPLSATWVSLNTLKDKREEIGLFEELAKAIYYIMTPGAKQSEDKRKDEQDNEARLKRMGLHPTQRQGQTFDSKVQELLKRKRPGNLKKSAF